MKNVIVEFDERKASKKANEYFIKICGFREGNDKHKKMVSLGMDSRCQGMSGIRIKTIISSYSAEVFLNRKVVVEGTEFHCPAFEKIERNCVKKIYVYALTVGGCIYSDEDDIMRQVFSDIWGTAYTDSARDLLEEYLKWDMEQEYPGQLGKTLFLSNAFGPGFYGMDLSQIKDLFRILDAGSIGMQVKDSGIMLPQKSCSGLYFAVTSTEGLPHPDCKKCIGGFMGCSFCKFRPERGKQ